MIFTFALSANETMSRECNKYPYSMHCIQKIDCKWLLYRLDTDKSGKY